MKVLLVSNGHFDCFLRLASALDGLIDCTVNIQIEQNTFRQSILDYTIGKANYGVDVCDDDTERIRDGIKRLVGKDLDLVFSKYPSRSFRDTRNWKVSWEWLQWTKRQQFDVINYNATSMPFFQQILLNQRGQKVFTVHDHATHLGEDAPQTRWLYRYMVWRKRHRFIAQSEHVRRGYIAEYNVAPERVAMIRYGALDLYRKWDDGSVHEDPKMVLFFGRISPYKGLEYLAEAWRIVRERVPDAQLIIAGEGKMYFDAEGLMRDPRVEVHNRYVDNAALAILLRKSSLVVLPYVEATQSGVVMTAYAFQKPVVASRAGGLPEVVEDGVTGHIVPPRDPAALAGALIDLLENPEKRASMSKAIREKVEKEFSWKRIAEQTIEVYRSCLG